MSSTNDSNDPVSANALNTSTTQSDVASTANKEAGVPSSASSSQHLWIPGMHTAVMLFNMT